MLKNKTLLIKFIKKISKYKESQNYYLSVFFPLHKIYISKNNNISFKLRKEYSNIIDIFVGLLILPISFLVSKDKNIVVFMGKEHYAFADNVKYLYLYATSQKNLKAKAYYLGNNKKIHEELIKIGGNSLLYPSLKSIWILLRANIIVVDSIRWICDYKYHFAARAKKIQLWHGVGFKKIRQLSKKPLAFFRNTLDGELICYDTLISTSDFYSDNVFKPAFKPKECLNLGYPRTDILYNSANFNGDTINTDIQSTEKIIEFKSSGGKTILYAPTFRNQHNFDITKENLNLKKLAEFCKNNNILFVIKSHSLPECKMDVSNYDNVIEYDNSKDIYQIMNNFDLMITDYSSIYMDYILIDKPCVFYSFDYDYYVKNCRDIQFDYDWITPGPKCFNQDELHNIIYKILFLNEDAYKEKRAEIRDLAWQYQDGKSSERIWDYIQEKYIS